MCIIGAPQGQCNQKNTGNLSTKYPFDEKLDFCLRENRLPFEHSKEDIWQKIESKIQSQPGSVSSSPSRWLKIAAAIAFAIVGLSYAYFLTGKTEITNIPGTIADISLPDGSEVLLNGKASLAYNSALWPFSRVVELTEGEAFFEVEKGSKFTVNTPKGNVSVLGTSFNVSLVNNGFDVACKTGSVQVEVAGNRQGVVLSPGDLLKTQNNEIALSRVPANEIGNWMKGEFIFDKIAIKDVLEIVAQQTGYAISLSPGIDDTYTGQFNESQSLKEILDIVCLPLDLNYTIDKEAKQVNISKK